MVVILTHVTKKSGTGAAMPSAAPIRGHQKFMVSDLPFPGGRTLYWQKYFIPPLVAWAGSQPDPFGTNPGVESKAVLIWNRVLPTIILDQKDRETLVGMVCILSNYSWSQH